MENKKEKFMTEALRLARDNLNKGNGGPFGALVVKDGEIIATGVNRVIELNDPSAHAEIIAIRNACRKLNTYQLSDCEIYSSCEPCPMCMGAIYWSRLKKIYFAAVREDVEKAGFDDNYIYHELAKGINDRNIPAEQLLQDEAIKIFNLWKELDLGIRY
jgi:tRNA(Arg) A34 adenosine deaminase TadA